MTPLWVSPEIVVPFVARIAGLRPDFGNCVTMAVMDRERKMAAGLIFHNWEPESGVIEVTAAATSPKWATRSILRSALSYCFDDVGCQMVVARHAETNKQARRLWAALGAQEYIIPRLRGRDAAEVLATLTDDAWAKSKLNEAANG